LRFSSTTRSWGSWLYRTLQHQHIANGLGRHQPDQSARLIYDAHGRHRLFLKQPKGIFQAAAFIHRGNVGGHRIGHACARPALLQRTDQIVTPEYAQRPAIAVHDRKLAAARIVYLTGLQKRIPFTTKASRALVTPWARRCGGLELMFQVAVAGAAGINFHGGAHNRRASDDKAYTPIARGGDRYRAMPLYYSMLMFAQAARGALVPAHLMPDTSDLKAFAVRAPEGILRICLINQNITRDHRVTIDSGRKFAVASTLRLAGPAIGSTAGVTLGGATVDEVGTWAPQ
jgi:hypothetical protein